MSTTTNLELFKHDNPSTNQEQFDIEKALNENWNKIDEAYKKQEDQIKNLEEDNKQNKQKLENLENYDDTEVKTSISNLQNEDTKIKNDIKSLQNKDIEIFEQIETKVDKIEGKNLSQNDFTDDYKSKLDNLSNYDDTSLKTQINANRNNIKALEESKVDKVQGKALSTNDFTNALKQKLEGLENYNDTNVKARIATLETDNTRNKQEIENIKKKDVEQDIEISNIQKEQTEQNEKIETNTEEITAIKEMNNQQDTKIQTNIDSINEIKERELIQDENIEIIARENVELKAECERLREDIKALPSVAGNGESITLKETAEARLKEFRIGGNTIQEGEPSLESPAEIKNVKDSVDVTVCNKNLSILPFFHTGVNTTEIGYVKKGKTYTLSFNVIPTVGYNVRYLISKEVIEAKQQTTGKQEIVFTATQDDHIYINGWEISEVNNEYYENIQLEEGEKATEYEEHQEQNFTIPVQEEMLIGDKFVKIEGLWKEAHNYYKALSNELIGRVGDLYGYESISREKTCHFRTNFSNTFIGKQNGQVISSKFVRLYNNWSSEIESVSNISSDGVRLDFVINKERIPEYSYDLSYDERNRILTNFFLTIDAVFYVELEKTYYVDCTEEQIEILEEIEKTAKSYQGTTHIYSTDEISPIFEVEARKDLQVENDKLQIQIDEIKELLSTTATSAMLLDNMQAELESEVM